MIAAVLIVLALLAAALQAALPTAWWLGGLRLELLPALVAYGALTLPRHPVSALMVAITAGLAHDALSAAPFGLTALAYGSAVVAILLLDEILDPELPWVQMTAGAIVAASAGSAACTALGFSPSAIGKLIVLALISAALTRTVYLLLGLFRHWWEAVDA
jgi:cell shape-determining protein MreD